MPDIRFNGTYLTRKHTLEHFPAKYKSVFPTTTADSGVISDEATDLLKAKVNVGNVRSKIPITTSSGVAYFPMK
jgi:hypothetical protein